MTYQIHVSSDGETIKYAVSEKDVRGIKAAQAQGQKGIWVGGEYISMWAIKSITKDTETRLEPLSDLLALPDEDPKNQRERIKSKLQEMRKTLVNKGILRTGDKSLDPK